MHRNLVLLFALGFMTNLSKASHSKTIEISVKQQLDQYLNLNHLPIFEEGTISGMQSSYDTTGGNQDGFTGQYSYIRKNEKGHLVIFEEIGPGVIQRIWTPTPTKDTLDFYIDSDKPSFSIVYEDLFSGKVYPFITPLCGNEIGGFYNYFPIPFQKNCKIVCRGKQLYFHQIQFKQLQKETEIKPFQMELTEDEKESLKKIELLWLKNAEITNFYSAEELSKTEVSIKDIKVFDSDKGGRILGIEIYPALKEVDKSIFISIQWDGDTGIYCPIIDLFGYAFGQSSMKSLFAGTDNKKNYCYLPMPYDKRVTIEVIGIDKSELLSAHKVIIYHSNEARKPNEGKLFVHHNYGEPLKGKAFDFVSLKGKGHYVGTILESQGLKSTMTTFFEGDDSTIIDGKFRMHGTGSEDYFNGGWYACLDKWDRPISLPLHGCLEYNLPANRTGGYRWFLNDKMSFNSSFEHSIEHGPDGNQYPVYYNSLAFFYADKKPVLQSRKLSVDPPQIIEPDTFTYFPQLMKTAVWGNINMEQQWKYDELFAASLLISPHPTTVLKIFVEEVPPGEYDVVMDITYLPSSCEFSIWQGQQQISDWINTYSKEERRTSDFKVCTLNLTTQKDALSFKFKGNKDRRHLLFSQLKLIRKKG